jgi:protein-tyrosine phosphatase
VKGKILAFAGPSFERNVSPEGYCTLAPSDYIPYFQRKNVGLVVRLNKRCYNEQDFVNAGIKHVDAFFLDGSCPPTKVLYKVLEAFENCETAVAVHCKAGLGRTGTCIGAYLMKHYRFSAAEAIAWMRICRPGCVIGPQQHYLKQIEARMWAEGEAEGRHVERSLPAAGEAEDEEDEVIMMDANDREAAAGRAGQAEALLSARGRRGHQATTINQEQACCCDTRYSIAEIAGDTALVQLIAVY